MVKVYPIVSLYLITGEPAAIKPQADALMTSPPCREWDCLLERERDAGEVVEAIEQHASAEARRERQREEKAEEAEVERAERATPPISWNTPFMETFPGALPAVKPTYTDLQGSEPTQRRHLKAWHGSAEKLKTKGKKSASSGRYANSAPTIADAAG